MPTIDSCTSHLDAGWSRATLVGLSQRNGSDRCTRYLRGPTAACTRAARQLVAQQIRRHPPQGFTVPFGADMRITLVHPAGFNFVPGQPDFSVLANRMAPIGILQLAAWLERHGHPCAVHDCLGPCAPTSIDGQCRDRAGDQSGTGRLFRHDLGLHGCRRDRRAASRRKRPTSRSCSATCMSRRSAHPCSSTSRRSTTCASAKARARCSTWPRAGTRGRSPTSCFRDGERHRLQPAPPSHPRSRRSAVSGLREAGRLPARLPPAAVLLRQAARRDHDHLARLPLHLLVLRPHGVRAPVQDQLRRSTSTST